jgi:hypothetical protein
MPTINAQILAIETPDTAHFRTPNLLTLITIEAQDTAHFRTANLVKMAATDPTDIARFGTPHPAALHATEQPDRAHFMLGAVRATLAARDTLDSAAFHGGARPVTAALSATETPDVAQFVLAFQKRFSLRATETPDAAQFTLYNSKTVWHSTEAPDQALFLFGFRHTASFALTEPTDTAHWVAFTGHQAFALKATEPTDRAAFVLAPPQQLPCEPVWTRPLDYYLDLITSEHNQKPNYIGTVTATIEPLVIDEATIASIPCLFDVDVATGVALDYTGQWIGKSRWIELPNVFFSWDTPGLGWDQSNWKGPYDSENALQRLDDYHYRMLLYATIVANHWDGSIPEAYRSWDTVFAGTGIQVVIQDWGNMTMAIGVIGPHSADSVSLSLIMSGAMNLKPEGITLLDYIFQQIPGVPLFAWDAESDSVAGWDQGQWGILVPPGQGYVPGA